MDRAAIILAVCLMSGGIGLGQAPAMTAKQEQSPGKLLFLIEAKYTDAS